MYIPGRGRFLQMILFGPHACIRTLSSDVPGTLEKQKPILINFLSAVSGGIENRLSPQGNVPALLLRNVGGEINQSTSTFSS